MRVISNRLLHTSTGSNIVVRNEIQVKLYILGAANTCVARLSVYRDVHIQTHRLKCILHSRLVVCYGTLVNVNHAFVGGILMRMMSSTPPTVHNQSQAVYSVRDPNV